MVAASTNAVLVGWTGNAAIDMTGGSLDVTGAGGDQVLCIGEQYPRVFTQSNGSVTTNYLAFARESGGATGIYNLNGGTLSTGPIYRGAGISGDLNLNGGILKATSNLSVDMTNWIASGVNLNLGVLGGVIDTTGRETAVNSSITGTGVLTLQNNDSGYYPIVLAGANTSSGDVTIDSGFVKLGAENALGSGVLTFGGASYRASLCMNGLNQTVRGLVAPNAGSFQGDIYNLGLDGFQTSTLTIATQAGDSFTYNNQIGVVNDWRNVNLAKQGSGIQILGGANYYTGITTVAGGTLLVNGAIANLDPAYVGGDVTVTAGTLGGSGTIDRNVIVESGGRLAPLGTLSLGYSLALNAGAALDFDLGASSDLVHFTTIADHLVGSGAASLNLTLNSGFDYAGTYTLFDNVTTTGFAFSNITGYDSAAYTAQVAQDGTSYNLSFVAVPEPGALALLAMGIVGLFAWKLRKQNSLS
jgi:fibronectin-binding autotransporter adhesin